MELNFYIIFAASLILIGGGYYYSLRRRGETSDLFRNSLSIAIAPAVIITLILYLLSTEVFIIYPGGAHDSKSVLWSCTVDDGLGGKQKLGGLGLANKYIYNATGQPLEEYSVYYGKDASPYSSQPALYIDPGMLTKTAHEPDFYFEEPERISVEKGIFESIRDLFGGESYERWIINYANSTETDATGWPYSY